jgi:hypothetical protein
MEKFYEKFKNQDSITIFSNNTEYTNGKENSFNYGLGTLSALKWGILSSIEGKKVCYSNLGLTPSFILNKIISLHDGDSLKSFSIIYPEEDSNSFENFYKALIEEDLPDCVIIDNIDLFMSYFKRSFNDISDFFLSFTEKDIQIILTVPFYSEDSLYTKSGKFKSKALKLSLWKEYIINNYSKSFFVKDFEDKVIFNLYKNNKEQTLYKTSIKK